MVFFFSLNKIIFLINHDVFKGITRFSFVLLLNLTINKVIKYPSKNLVSVNFALWTNINWNQYKKKIIKKILVSTFLDKYNFNYLKTQSMMMIKSFYYTKYLRILGPALSLSYWNTGMLVTNKYLAFLFQIARFYFKEIIIFCTLSLCFKTPMQL